METNPYAPPASSPVVSTVQSSSVLTALRYGTLAYLAALVAFFLLGCLGWVLSYAIDSYRYGQAGTFTNWWYVHALHLIDGPLIIGSSVFGYFATRQRINGYLGFGLILATRFLVSILLDIFHLGSPRHLKGDDPLLYPVELWSAVVSCAVATLATFVWSIAFPRRETAAV